MGLEPLGIANRSSPAIAMDYISPKKPFSFFIILTLHLVQTIHVFAGLEPYEIYIVNNLPDNTNPLFIHCKSKDNDLGVLNLAQNTGFRWHFRMNIWENTLYFCGFLWARKNTTFTVFDFSLADHECGRKIKDNICYWSVQYDGFYLVNVLNPPPGSLKKMQTWQ